MSGMWWGAGRQRASIRSGVPTERRHLRYTRAKTSYLVFSVSDTAEIKKYWNTR